MARATEPDWAAIYIERRRSLANLGGDEPHFRSFDFTVGVCRERTGLGLEEAKKLVRDAIAKGAAQ
jgi:hypothetical protein